MFENDYLMKLLVNFAAAIRRAMVQENNRRPPLETARMLDLAVGDAVDLDPETLLTLSPESAAGLLQLSDVDPQVTEYVSRSLLLASSCYKESGDDFNAALRAGQAHAIAEAYGHDLPGEDMSIDDMEEFLLAKESSNDELSPETEK